MKKLRVGVGKDLWLWLLLVLYPLLSDKVQDKYKWIWQYINAVVMHSTIEAVTSLTGVASHVCKDVSVWFTWWSETGSLGADSSLCASLSWGGILVILKGLIRCYWNSRASPWEERLGLSETRAPKQSPL